MMKNPRVKNRWFSGKREFVTSADLMTKYINFPYNLLFVVDFAESYGYNTKCKQDLAKL
jgi:hypothetical protein